jgi:glycine cleavage system aminomethyltransferase T
LRLEMGYPLHGNDISEERTPLEAGLSWAVALDKGEFVGRDALVAAGEDGPRQKLVCITLADPRRVALGNEPVRIDGDVVGRVTTGGYGYTVERSIAYAYLPAALAVPGTELAIEIFGSWIEGEVAAEPLFDQAGERIRS